MTRYCWITVDYVGAGLVIQRQVTTEGAPVTEHYWKESGEWSNKFYTGETLERTRARERIVHITETDIDTTIIEELI